MLIILIDGTGCQKVQSFDHSDMQEAADYCLKNRGFRIHVLVEDGEEAWDKGVWQAMLIARGPLNKRRYY